jgi:uncharacterized membrane protein YoaK (UPF0700 family)
VSRSFAHEAKAGEVVCLALGPLILLCIGGVIAGEVKVTEGSTRSGHCLLELLLLLLLLVPEAVVLLVIALITGVIPVVVLVLVGGGAELLPLGADGDEVGGVTILKVAPQ